MAYFNVCVLVERNVPREQLDPEDAERGPVGEYWVEVETDSGGLVAEVLGLEWFHDIYQFARPEDHRVSVRVMRAAA